MFRLFFSKTTPLYRWVVVSMSCLFLFYKYIAQISPSVMTQPLMAHFHLHAAGLASLIACYFPAYLAAQFFAGPLLDRYSARFISTAALALISLGLWNFSSAQHLWQGYLWRACMGVGAAFATVSYLKLAAVFFDKRQFAYVAGWLATASSIGGMIAQTPVAEGVAHLGWSKTLSLCALLGVAIVLLYGFIVRDTGLPDTTQPSLKKAFHGFKRVACHKKVLLLAVYSGLAWAPMAVFCGLWGNSFLETAFHASKVHAASWISMSFIGLAIGGPVFGWLAHRLQDLYRPMMLGLICSLCGLLYVIYAPASFNELALISALWLFGFGTGAFMSGFALGRHWFSLGLVASVIAVLNTGDAFFGAVTEPLVGRILDAYWTGATQHGAPVFSAHAYHMALALLPGYLLLAAFILKYIQRLDRVAS